MMVGILIDTTDTQPRLGPLEYFLKIIPLRNWLDHLFSLTCWIALIAQFRYRNVMYPD